MKSLTHSALSPIVVVVVIASLAALGVGCSQPTSDDPVDDSSSSIVGGTLAKPNAYPGAVALYSQGYQVCGGALVAEQWVMTASHCVEPTQGANGGIDNVVIGRQNLSQTSVGESIKVDHAYRNPGFTMKTMDDDVALLHLVSKSTGAHTKLVSKAQASEIVAGANVTVVGWGITKENAQNTVTQLRQVTVPIVSTAQCNTWYQGQGSSGAPAVSDDQICAGLTNGGKDSCQGDSGGPLFMKINGENVQVGLVSWGDGCAEAQAPGIYTNLWHYLDWLSSKSGGDIVTN